MRLQQLLDSFRVSRTKARSLKKLEVKKLLKARNSNKPEICTKTSKMPKFGKYTKPKEERNSKVSEARKSTRKFLKISYLEAAAALRIISRKFNALEATDSIWWSKEDENGAELWLEWLEE